MVPRDRGGSSNALSKRKMYTYQTLYLDGSLTCPNAERLHYRIGLRLETLITDNIQETVAARLSHPASLWCLSLCCWPRCLSSNAALVSLPFYRPRRFVQESRPKGQQGTPCPMSRRSRKRTQYSVMVYWACGGKVKLVGAACYVRHRGGSGPLALSARPSRLGSRR